jgi:hypothetical protein
MAAAARKGDGGAAVEGSLEELFRGVL